METKTKFETDAAEAAASNAVPTRGKLSQLMPMDEVRVELLSPDDDRIHDDSCQREDNAGVCKCKGVWCIFGFLDGKTKADYDRTMEKGITRGGGKKGGYSQAVKDLFLKKCLAIEGLTEDDCDGYDPKQFFCLDGRGRVMMKTAVNEYLRRSLPSADESKN